MQAGTQASPASPRRKTGTLVRFEICDRAGQRLHDGRLNGEFPDRASAIEAIKLHLQQFEAAGFDRRRGYWWGRSLCGPGEETRFFVR
jgi:hypothetical protein